MKKSYFLICFGFLSTVAFAHERLIPQHTANTFEHLFEVNQNWNRDFLKEKEASIQFTNDIDRISYHLLKVEQLLKEKSTENLNSQQQVNRTKMLAILHDYALAKKFPINSFHKERTPYFIDIHGTHCAVGYLVQQSGFGHISLDISARQNYSYVRDIDAPELLKWAQNFGFEVDELALIQPGYPSNITYSQVGEGVNGRVKTLAEGADGTIYLGGDFTQIGDTPCNHVAYYQNNQLSCFGGGLDGIVNDIEEKNGAIYVAGKFEFGNLSYPLAIFENGAWSFTSFLNVDQTIGMSINTTGNKISISLYVDANKSIIYEKFPFDNQWYWLMETNGPVYTISSNGYSEKTYGGKFDTAIVQSYIVESGSTTSFIDTIYTKNVLQEEYYDYFPTDYHLKEWHTFNQSIPDVIYCSASQGLNTYIGGSAAGSSTPEFSSVLMSRILNYDAQPAIDLNFYSTSGLPMSMYDISINPNTSRILIGGYLDLNADMMTQSRNVFYYDPITSYVEDAGYILSPVHSVLMTEAENFIGGDFTQSSWSSPANHIAKTSHHLEVEENTDDLSFTVFPNPANDYLQIKLSNSFDFDKIQITDLTGKTIETSIDHLLVDVSKLSPAVYFVQLIKEGQIIGFERFVKN